jgi:hypothetical protein
MMHFNTTTGEFHGEYTLNTQIPGATIVYLNHDYWHPYGYDYGVICEQMPVDNDQITISVDYGFFRVLFTGDKYEGKTIQIYILPTQQ